jgi:hypothetical protein
MGGLIDFAKRIEEKLDRSNREPRWAAGGAERYK